MVLISIHPFAFRKLLLIVVAFLGFSALCFADPVLMVRRYSAPPDSPKASAQIGGESLAAVEIVRERAPGLTEPEFDLPSPSGGTLNPVCVLRSTVSTDSSLAEAPARKI